MKKFQILVFLTCCLNLNFVFAQTSTLGNSGVAGDYLGWDNITALPLQIRQDNITTPYSIEFWTKATKQMEIDGTNGNVGISTTPVTGVLDLKLSVDNDINLNSSAWMHGYWINRKLILSTPGIRNTLVGENAGNTNSGSYQQNVCVGYNSGANLITGNFNL